VVDFGTPSRRLTKSASNQSVPTDNRMDERPETKSPVRRRRTLRRVGSEEQSPALREAPAAAPDTPRDNESPWRSEDVVAVCVYLARPDPRFA
jgi:hypothetical protein